jgi:hypothetical protein
METNVKFTQETRSYLEDLVTVLYQKQYFSWVDLSEKYVDELVDGILSSLPRRLHKPAPERYAKYGEDLHYTAFPKNKRTT